MSFLLFERTIGVKSNDDDDDVTEFDLYNK